MLVVFPFFEVVIFRLGSMEAPGLGWLGMGRWPLSPTFVTPIRQRGILQQRVEVLHCVLWLINTSMHWYWSILSSSCEWEIQYYLNASQCSWLLIDPPWITMNRCISISYEHPHLSHCNTLCVLPGHLVSEFLQSGCNQSPLDYCQSVMSQAQQYEGFNIITARFR